MPSKRLLAAALTVAAIAAGTQAATAAPVVTSTNPVSAAFGADTFADPSIIQGRDGYWYAYATSDPLVANGPFGLMHMARTKDFHSWEYLGTVFN
ncbi:MAG TPA: glycoside hydrolase family 43, partial [Kribbella sp.]|nr:glycoside hydrolase family 43 [Kribbella sp.]